MSACGQAPAIIGIILASMIQSKGPSEGSWFDPVDFRPLFLSDAMREALRIFVQLQAHSVDNRTACQAVYGMMASGRCLMLWGHSFAFKRGSAPSGPLRGRQGVARIPGSRRVLDRSTGHLVPCTPERCPYATPYSTTTATVESTTLSSTMSISTSSSSTTATETSRVPCELNSTYYKYSSSNSTTSELNSQPPSTVNCSLSTAATAPSVELVNRVYPLECISFTINAFAPLPRQAAAFALLHTFTTPSEHLRIMLSPESELGPLRFSELEEDLWIETGYEPDDVRSFLEATREFLTHPNVYFSLRIPGVFELYALMQNLTQRAIVSKYPYDTIMSDADAATKDIIRQAGGKTTLLSLYRSSIDFHPPSPPSAPAPVVAMDGQQKRQQILLVSVLVPIMGVLLLGAVALWGYVRYSRFRKGTQAALSAAPGAGPTTTLLVTDIQDSTVLWEGLPAEVMDAAVKLHHRVIREQLLKHKGYESATEGDSFILAFEKPDRALSFSLAAQGALLHADWPAALTASDSAATLLVTCNAATCAAVMPYLAPSRLRTVLASSLDGVLAAGGGAGGPSSSNRGLLEPPPPAYGSQYDMMSRRWPRAATVTRALFSAARLSSGSHHTFSGVVSGGSGGATDSGAGAVGATSATATGCTQSPGQALVDRISRRSFDMAVRHYSGKTLKPPSAFAMKQISGVAGSGPVAVRSHRTHCRTDTGMVTPSVTSLAVERSTSVGRTKTPELMCDDQEDEVDALPSVTVAAAAAALLDVGGVNGDCSGSVYGDDPGSSRPSLSIGGNIS
ncbi:hypothetical protein Vretimale_18827, partial [Volvox reticuliferus]